MPEWHGRKLGAVHAPGVREMRSSDCNSIASELRPEQSQPVVTTKAQRQRAHDGFGKGQALEAPEAIGLGEAAAVAEAMEVDGATLAILANVRFVEGFDGDGFGDAAFTEPLYSDQRLATLTAQRGAER